MGETKAWVANAFWQAAQRQRVHAVREDTCKARLIQTEGLREGWILLGRRRTWLWSRNHDSKVKRRQGYQIKAKRPRQGFPLAAHTTYPESVESERTPNQRLSSTFFRHSVLWRWQDQVLDPEWQRRLFIISERVKKTCVVLSLLKNWWGDC